MYLSFLSIFFSSYQTQPWKSNSEAMQLSKNFSTFESRELNAENFNVNKFNIIKHNEMSVSTRILGPSTKLSLQKIIVFIQTFHQTSLTQNHQGLIFSQLLKQLQSDICRLISMANRRVKVKERDAN